MKTKILVIRAKTPEDLVREINNHSKDFFATQPKVSYDGSWVAFCYYHDDDKDWTKQDVSEGQNAFIKKNEFSLRKLGFKIDDIQNRGDAHKIIKEFKNIKKS